MAVWQQTQTYLSELVKLVIGTPVILIRRPPAIFALLNAAYVWSPAGLYRKSIINLDLSEGRPICCSRLTVTSAVRPEERDRFMTSSSEAQIQFPLSHTWKRSLKEVTGDLHKRKLEKISHQIRVSLDFSCAPVAGEGNDLQRWASSDLLVSFMKLMWKLNIVKRSETWSPWCCIWSDKNMFLVVC